jgi:hypothetical protein
MRSTKEIAAEIIDEIRNAKPAAEVCETFIHDLIGDLTSSCIRDSKYGNRKQNKRHAQKVIDWIEDGHSLLAGRPDTFDAALLFREEPTDPNWTLDAASARQSLHRTGERNTGAKGFAAIMRARVQYMRDEFSVMTESARRERSLKGILAGMRRQAKFIIDNEIGAHGNSGQDQKLAAEVALALVAKHGLPATYSSESSVYCNVARLCFEAITGRYFENGEEIYRACKLVAMEHPAVECTQLAPGLSPLLALFFVKTHIAVCLRRELRLRGRTDADFDLESIGTENAAEE